MGSFQHIVVVLTLCMWIGASVCCETNDIAVYKVKFQTLWDEETFPTYPINSERQWSPLFVQSHNRTYNLYSEGNEAKKSVRQFVQNGSLDRLQAEGEDDMKVYDQFVTPAIDNGVGETNSFVFVDTAHSLISLISRMIPSLDWFVGVDSLDMCIDFSWVETITLDLNPLDAGTTSTDEPEFVEKVSHRNPEFPSPHFYFRRTRKPSPIAKVEFTKIKEYSTKEFNNFAREELFSTIKSKHYKKESANTFKGDWRNVKEVLSTKSPFDQLIDLEEDAAGTPKPNVAENYVDVVTQTPNEIDSSEDLRNMDDVVIAVAKGRRLGLNKHLPRHFKSRLHHAVNKQGIDCIVSDWSAWSECVEPCTIGEMTRMRTVLQKRTGKGKECPPLLEKRLCKHKCRGDYDYQW